MSAEKRDVDWGDKKVESKGKYLANLLAEKKDANWANMSAVMRAVGLVDCLVEH